MIERIVTEGREIKEKAGGEVLVYICVYMKSFAIKYGATRVEYSDRL